MEESSLVHITIRQYLWILCAGLILAHAGHTFAQEKPTIPRTDEALESEEAQFHFESTVGFGAIDEDYFLKLDLGINFQLGQWSAGVAAPLHFVMMDEDPSCDCIIRNEDWDELNDYMRIIRFVQYGKPADRIYARIGELKDVSIGHGTVVDRYYNVVDINHYKLGFRTNIDLDYGGFELLVDSLTSQPNVIALRPFVRPFTFFDVEPILKGLSVGLVFAADFFAPEALKTDTDGSLDVSSTNTLKTSSTGIASVYGLDMDWQFVLQDWVSLVPFVDLLAMNDFGFGSHVGAFLNFELPMDMHIDTRWEWRYASGQYQPSYFNSLYEIERWSFTGGPKLAAVRSRNADDARHGFLGSIDFRVANWLTVGSTYEDYQGPNNSNLTIRASLPYIFGVKAAAFYSKRSFEGFSEVFSLDDAMLVGMLRWNFWGPMVVTAEYARQWQVNDEGSYETTDTWNTGVGAEFSF